MTKKITIITTRQNFKWISMQEVLPALEKCWPEMAVAKSFDYRLINIDESPLRSIMSFLIQSDAIVIIAFNETIAKFMKEVRVKLKLPIPFIFHLHGLATIALWPFDHFQIMDSLNEGDAFIGTCDGDRNCLELVFEKSSFHRVPYPFYPLELKNSPPAPQVFAYVGRISDQKNIDVLINAYQLLTQEVSDAPLFYIYGEDDFLGSPNMGIAATRCLDTLKDLVRNHRLDEKIIFKGFKDRDELYGELGGNHIALSASTHSDENFGMAIMRSLSLGANAVITEWGGHLHFKSEFPQRVIGVPVLIDGGAPRPGVKEMKEAMTKSLSKEKASSAATGQEATSYFDPQTVGQKFFEIVEGVHYSDKRLIINPIIKKLFEQKNQFTQNGEIQRVFESYQDQIALSFLRSYQ